MQFRKTLEELVIDNKEFKNAAICYNLPIRDRRKVRHYIAGARGVFNFYVDLRFNIISIVNKKYLLPGFKKAARECEVQYIEYPSFESAEKINQLAQTRNVLWLLQPQIVFFSNNTHGMGCFITRIAPDASRRIGAKYLVETSFRTDEPLPPCVPIIKLGDVRRMATSADHMQELKRINEAVLGHYSPQAERFCYNYKPPQSHNSPAPIISPHCDNYAMFSIVGGCAIAPIRSLAPGMFLGMIASFTDHIHRDTINQHPVACGLACIASSAMGYYTVGSLGVALNLSCWAWQNYLYREPGIKSRFWGYKLLQSLSVSPLLIGGIYHFAIGMAGLCARPLLYFSCGGKGLQKSHWRK